MQLNTIGGYKNEILLALTLYPKKRIGSKHTFLRNEP